MSGAELFNYYELLEVPINAPLKTIQKAFRKAALKYHPDKNKTAKAVALYARVKEAQDVLFNEEKRKEYDGKMKLRLERQRKAEAQDGKLREMRNALERRERESQQQRVSKDSKKHEDVIRQQNQDLLDRVKQQTRQARAAHIASVVPRARAPHDDTKGLSEEDQNSGQDLHSSTLSVKWSNKGAFTELALRKLFTRFGPVAHIVFKPTKALVNFAHAEDAAAALIECSHRADMTVSLVGAKKRKRSEEEEDKDSVHDAPAPQADEEPGGDDQDRSGEAEDASRGPSVVTAAAFDSHEDFEQHVLRAMMGQQQKQSN